MPGIFTISLDFELHWGGFEKWPLEISNFKFQIEDSGGYESYFQITRKVIPEMLFLFEKYKVHVTWATVGMLMHENKKQLLENSPHSKPSYVNKVLSAYEYINSKGIGESEEEDPFHYADSIIKKIVNTPYQELGSHSYAHYYCNEEGQTLEQFRADLKAAQKAASRYGVTLKSLVFPRNQFNDQYLQVCYEEGFTSVRSNPLDWFWNIDSTQDEGMWKRLNRGADAYFPVGKKNTYALNQIVVRKELSVCIPASRLLRPYRPEELFLNKMKINRIKQEMQRAAKAEEVYHLWWHPHNFGSYPKESLEALESILIHYQWLKSKYGMQSHSMGELASILLSFS